MRTIKIALAVLAIAATTQLTQAQFNPFSDNTKMATVGIGVTGWGIPIFGRIEFPVYDNITVGGQLSFQTKGENFGSSSWRHTIFGLGARGSYHFNELAELDDKWDLYAGLGLGYYFWNTKLKDDDLGTFDYSGSGNGGFSIGLHVGGRYFVNDNIGINLELGGGTVLAGATIGATFLF
jgi:hypothetical protein